ncbi:MAG: prepilin peptidase [Clostridiales bacterium]|nr:prepilin peptidase [Clostridiales bacterium]
MNLVYPLFADNMFATIYLLVIAFCFGAVFASFITCTACRVVIGEDWTKGHSHCDSCKHELSMLDLIPIVSWLALKGKCRYCGAKVPARDVIFEIVLGLAFAGTLAFNLAVDPVVIQTLVLEVLLLGLSLADYDNHIIPDGFLLAMLIVWIIFVGFMPDTQGYALDGIIAVVVIAGIMLLITLILNKVLKKQSIGMGDIKLFACCMLFTGLYRGVLTLFLASMIGLLIAAIGRKKKIAFAPAISIATIISLVFGGTLINMYFGLIGG